MNDLDKTILELSEALLKISDQVRKDPCVPLFSAREALSKRIQYLCSLKEYKNKTGWFD